MSDVVDSLRDDNGQVDSWLIEPAWEDRFDKRTKEATAESALKRVIAAEFCTRLMLSTLEKHAANEPRLGEATSDIKFWLDKLQPLPLTPDDLKVGIIPKHSAPLEKLATETPRTQTPKIDSAANFNLKNRT